MNRINKQKFLTELGRLLTFMYEEDRQKALSMYNRMFEETEDEQGLLQLLVSPTRQAVVLARSSDAKERKLQAHAQQRDEYAAPEPEACPPFVLVIEQIAEQAGELAKPRSFISKEQMSLFDDVTEAKSEAEVEAPEAAAEVAEEAAQEPEAADDESVPEQSEAALPFPDLPALETAANTAEEEAAEADRTEDAAPELPAGAEIPEELQQTASRIDSFLNDFAIQEEAAAEQEEKSSLAEEKPAAAAVEEKVRKLSALRLIPYLILAIPLTLLGIAILLIPTLLVLILAAAFIYVGIMTFTAAFGGFGVFADKLVLIGVGIALLALGLLFVWTFIWFLGGAIAGLIRGVFALGRKWCCKEVAKQ